VRTLHSIPAAVATVRARQRGPAASGDRGDSPIPSTIIIAGLAAIAIALLGWLGFYVLDFLNQAPTDLPEPPFGGN
jgi:hypothetical protein